MAINSNQTLPLNTPINRERKVSAIGKGKLNWITWKNLTYTILWWLFSAVVGLLIVPGQLWVKLLVFVLIGVFMSIFFLVPVPRKEYYWLYQYIYDSIKFYFARNANTYPNLGATDDFIHVDYIKGNKLFLKNTGSCQAFYRITGRNIYSSSEEVQNALLNDFHNTIKNMNGASIKFINFQDCFYLEDQFDYFNRILNDDEKIPTSFTNISTLMWQNWQYKRNFPFSKDTREKLNVLPTPRDVVYLVCISADSESVVDELCDLILPNLQNTDSDLVEPASSNDIKLYLKKQYGNTSLDLIHGFDKVVLANGETILKANQKLTNMGSLIFKPRYWITRDYQKVGNKSKVHYHKIISINNFSADATLGWLDPLFDDPAIDCLQVKLEEMNLDKQSKLIGKAINQYVKVEPTGGKDSFSQIKLQEIFTFLKELQDDTGKADVSLIKTTFYIKLSADSVDKLEKKETQLKYRLRKDLGIERKQYETYWFNQKNIFLSSLSTKQDTFNKKIGLYLLSSAIALGWPFNNPRLIQPRGFHIGFTANGLCPVCLDFASQRSFSGMIVGKTGSGKSMLAKLISLNLLLNPTNKLFWFDPENEMANFGANYNAIQLDLTAKTPVINKITFNDFKDQFLVSHLKWTEERFYNTYYALLDLENNYKYMFGVNDEQIKNLTPEEFAQKITVCGLVQESIDCYGLGSLKDHSKQVFISNHQITPEMVRKQVVALGTYVKAKTGLENPLDLYEMYSYLYQKTILASNINPYRIVLSSEGDLDNFNAFGLYDYHKQLLVSWFKELMPKASVEHSNFFVNTLHELYKVHCGIYETVVDEQHVINKTIRELIEKETYPTIEDHYKIMLDQYNKVIATKNQNSDPIVANQAKVMNEVLAVFDNLVNKNRHNQQGLFHYLWTKDNKFNFNPHQQLMIFNIQQLLTHVKNIKQNQYTDAIRFDFQQIFNAQYFLSQQLIWSYVVSNRKQNQAQQYLSESEKSHIYIFMDEAHASLKQPQFVDWSVNLIKRARKYSAGIWLITQSIGDYTKLPDASELFNNFMFKFYFQCEASAFDDVINKFITSKVPLTHQEERWLNPVLGDTTQGRCILTFEDGKRYMMNVITSTIFIRHILETNLFDNKPFIEYDELTNDYVEYGNGLTGWLNYIKSDANNYHESENDYLFPKIYEKWLDLNLKKYNHNDWLKAVATRKEKQAQQELLMKQQTAFNFQKSFEQSKIKAKGGN